MLVISDIFIVIISLTLIKNSVTLLEDERAKISTEDGNLFIETPIDRDIVITTQGSGKLKYKNMDLSELLTSVQRSFDGLETCRTDINVSNANIKSMDSKLKQLAQELTNMKNSTGKSINYTHLLMFTRRRVNMLQRKLKVISMLLLTNECASNPCSNGGTCFDMYNTFFCQCPSNWEGARCETDVNECSKFLGTELGCQNGATCVNKPGTYECLCPDGWFGLHCTKRSTDCSFGSELCGHGTCISQNTGIGYTCLCDQGWKTDGVKPACTVDVDECQSYKPPCSTNPLVKCVNLPGTFYCGHCPPGYTGNGYYCTDINECDIFNGGCSVNPLVQCINTLGSRTCGLCPPGYTGNGMYCTYQGGACAVNNGGCHPNAQCRDNSRISSTYVECICPPGYSGTGIGPFGCSPLATNPCNPNPCVHGECSIQGNGYVCKCDKKYSGVHCNILINPCDSNPCENGGTCRNLGYMFSCTCPQLFYGRTCEIGRSECGRIVGNGGTITYPDPNQTQPTNCTWIVEVPERKAVNITFTAFSFPNCGSNWLQISDATKIDRYCGTKPPKGGNLVSNDHIVHLNYRFSGRQPLPTFSLNWEAVDPVCGGEFNVTAFGTFKSPGAPGYYPNNRDCYWRFRAPLGKRFQFQFFTFMIGYNQDCSKDYLEFRQGLESTDPIIAKYCNSTHPEPLFSTGNEVLVHFHSDSSVRFNGFQITYNVVAGIPGCGGIFTLEEGEISSPAISGEYPPNTLCEYKIKLHSLSKVLIKFIQLSMEYSVNCVNDYLAIYDGPSVDSPLIGKYCGKKLPSEILSISSEILIVFKSDFSQADLGFKLRYKTVCNNKFTSLSGNIHSPNYPYYQTIKSRKHCVYEIVVPVGSILSLNITDMDFGNNTIDCDTGHLEVFDSENGKRKSIGKYCKQGPISIKSSYNYLMLEYVANFGKLKGFNLEYNAMSNNGCGGILTNKFGTIESPPDLNSYQDGLKCTWVLIAPSENVIQLNWIKFNLEQSYSCVYDNVKVIDNGTDPGSEIGTYCGTQLPPIIISSANILTINFQVDNSNNQEGFLLSYTFVQEKNLCGGSYFTTSGVIKSPHFPNPYPINKDCVWIITVPPGQQIMLNFTTFDIENYLNCRYDYLEIRNGGTSASPLIGKYCGKETPRNFVSSHTNQLYLRFKSDMTKTAPGFKILWSSVATGCGGTLTSPNGMIISPHYPEPYARNTECYWRISVAAGSVIQIVFADLDLEANPSCVLDYVEVFDGMGLNKKTLGKFCTQGLEVPPYLRSTANQMTIKFRSDLSFQGRGFQIQYTTVCNNEVNGFWGAIESPNYPNSFPAGKKCLWKVGVPRGNKINITFTHFELGKLMPTNSCSTDYLEIRYKSASTDENVKFTYCDSNIPTHLTIDSNETEVQVVSDNSIIGTGFRLEWNIFGCGGILKSPEGNITTPGYPQAYPLDTVCDWLITTEYGSSIEITFNKVDMEKDSTCMYDSISVYNGPDSRYPLLSQFCHSVISPIKLTSNGNSMFVRFESDNSYSGRGFEASYKTVNSKCGGVISSTSGSIHSPNFPENYDKNDSCVWLLQVHENHVINFTVEDLDFPKTYNKSFLKIYDGPTQAYPLLAYLWGNKKPNSSIVSTTNHMLVEMITHPYFVTHGFLAKFHMACGYIITDKSGYIKLNDQMLSILDEKCSYTIKGSKPGERVFLTITHMINECGYDNSTGVFIYDGMDANSSLIGKYCGSSAPPTISSTGQNLHFEIVNDDGHFEAHYTVMNSACGGSLESIGGFITTPEYPNNYPVDIQCEWTIPISEGNEIRIEFLNFDLADSDKCNEDYLEIREKDNEGKLLGVYCGNKNTPTNIVSKSGLWLFFKSAKPIIGAPVSTGKGFKANYEMVHGTNLNGTTGKIASPLYPRRYKGLLYYDNTFKWKINVNIAYAIRIKFLDFDVDYSSEISCSLSAVNVYDGPDENAPLLGSYCGTNLPPNLVTTSNVAFIVANLDFARMGCKFLLEWNRIYKLWSRRDMPSAQCGNDTSVIDISKTGSYNLTSPNITGRRWQFQNCFWEFSTTDDKHLAIKFNSINLKTLIPCIVGERVEIYTIAANSQDYQLKSNVCKMNQGLTIVETSNKMKVVFKIQLYFARENSTGFSAVIYEKCGGNVKGPNGIIEIQNSSFLYELNETSAECEWNVTVRSGRTIKVEFLNFQLGESDCKNYVMLKNGQFHDSPLLGAGKFCGNKNADSLETSGNYLYVKYYASRLTPSSFKLRYTEVSTACGGKILLSANDNSTIIFSPNFPNSPKPHTECEWIIIAPNGESIRLDFLESFDLQTDDGCTAEAVEIRDGGTQLSPVIGRYCNNIPNSQLSYGNIMYIKYFTDVDYPKNGFKARASIATCGGTLYFNGSITSPNYKNSKLYPANINCRWELIGSKGTVLKIRFDYIDLPFSFLSNCSDTDHVTVFSETSPINNTRKTVGEYCGRNAIKDIETLSNKVYVHFNTSKRRKNFNGFKLSFEESADNCGGTLNTQFGTITSPGYPVSTDTSRNCLWTIIVPKGQRIKITFEDLDLDTSFQFIQRGVAVFDGNMISSPVTYLKMLSTERTVRSSDNKMSVFFWSIYPSNNRGFKATYTSDEPTICVGDINKERGIIKSPNETTFKCTWERNTLLNKQTIGFFVKANISVPSKPCTSGSSYINIITGNPSTNIDTCKSTTEPLIFRTSLNPLNLMAIHLKTNQTMEFEITYKVYECGGTIIDTTGNITSPETNEDLECSWLINPPNNQLISVKFTGFDLGNACNKHYVSIYNGPTVKSPKIGQYCSTSPGSFKTNNKILIEYHRAKGSDGKGFSLTYETISNGCGGVIHAESGMIKTPSYPEHYPDDAECLWEIVAPLGYYINLNFVNRYQIEDSTDCKNDFVMIFDKREDELNPGITKYCGRDPPARTIDSKSNKIFILFRSNSRISGSGFNIKWKLHCGGTFVATSTKQYIYSPGYPEEYANNLLCQYEIVSNAAYVIVKFEEFELEKSQDCQDDYVLVKKRRDSFNHYFVTSSRYCGTNVVSPIINRNKIEITFSTDKYITKKGFKISYMSDECGGNITSPKELSYSALVGPLMYTVCRWKVTAPEGQRVTVRFLKMNMTFTWNCLSRNVEVSDSSGVLANICGNLNDTLLPIIHSNNREVVIKFRSVHKPSSFAAAVYFTPGPAQGCGGDIKVSNNSEYILNAEHATSFDCVWKFTTDYDYTFKIDVLNTTKCNSTNAVALPSMNGCKCVLYEIRNGITSYSGLIASFCDFTSNTSTSYYTSGKYAFIRIVNVASAGHKPKITLKSIPSLCGPSILQAKSTPQYLTTQNYPNLYQEGLKCSWHIKNNKISTQVEIKFIDFDINNNAHTNSSCSELDNLEITTSLIGTPDATYDVIYSRNSNFWFPHSTKYIFCNKETKGLSVASSANNVHLIFSGKFGQKPGRGIKVQYQAMTCVRNFTELYGTITKIHESKNGENCSMYITVPKNYTISLYFASDNYLPLNCNKSSLVVREGDAYDKVLLKTCNNFPDAIFSSSNKVHISLPDSKKYIHFNMVYIASWKDKGCGGNFYGLEGILTSPLYPQSYAKDITCEWTIKVPQGLRIKITFLNFNIQGSCTDTKFVIEKESQSLVYCATDKPARNFITGQVKIIYKTHPTNLGMGWKLTFQTYPVIDKLNIDSTPRTPFVW